jgi:hypothetical protein
VTSNTNAPAVQGGSLDDLAAQIKQEHQAVGHAATGMLTHALAAGDALNKAKAHLSHGEWGSWLLRHCDLGERTARVYMTLAKNRVSIEADWQHAAVLSLRGALTLIQADIGDTSPAKKSKPKSETKLSSLAWANASVDERRHFLDDIGLQSLLEALPSHFRIEIERRAARKNSGSLCEPALQIRKILLKALSSGSRDEAATALGRIKQILSSHHLDLHDLEIAISTAARAAA